MQLDPWHREPGKKLQLHQMQLAKNEKEFQVGGGSRKKGKFFVAFCLEGFFLGSFFGGRKEGGGKRVPPKEEEEEKYEFATFLSPPQRKTTT